MNIKTYLEHASTQYYAGTPVLDDQVFDALAQAYNYNSVGAPASNNKVKHVYPMYSLQKHYEDEGAHPLAGISDVSASPKLDGAALVLLYVDGQLTRAATRGDGVEGQDVTDKFLGSPLVPQQIEAPGVVQVSGELASPKHIENARNYAAGALNLKDVAEFRTRAVEFFAYGISPVNPDTTHNGDMRWLAQQGFATIKDAEIHNIYPCDGMVYRVNSNKLFLEMGYTAKHPRGAYALKERQEAVETQILAVEWQVGKTGKVSPVAILAPVMIGDAQVGRATLNNPGFIKTLGIEIGDTVEVIRAGMIIPQIIRKVNV